MNSRDLPIRWQRMAASEYPPRHSFAEKNFFLQFDANQTVWLCGDDLSEGDRTKAARIIALMGAKQLYAGKENVPAVLDSLLSIRRGTYEFSESHIPMVLVGTVPVKKQYEVIEGVPESLTDLLQEFLFASFGFTPDDCVAGELAQRLLSFCRFFVIRSSNTTAAFTAVQDFPWGTVVQVLFTRECHRNSGMALSLLSSVQNLFGKPLLLSAEAGRKDTLVFYENVGFAKASPVDLYRVDLYKPSLSEIYPVSVADRTCFLSLFSQKDAKEVLHLQKIVKCSVPDDWFFETAADEITDLSHSIGFVLREENGSLCGYCRFIYEPDPNEDLSESEEGASVVDTVFVDESVRGNGLQHLFLNLCIKEAAARGRRSLFATVHPQNKVSLRNFEKCGFRTERTVAKYGSVRCILRLDL